MPGLTELLHQELSNKRYFGILASTVCFAAIAPLIEHDVWSRAVFGMLGMVTLLTVSCGITAEGRRRTRMLVLALLSGTMWVAASFFKAQLFNTIAFELAASVCCLLFLAHACYVMLRDILSGSITANRICGAICVYILIGFCFAMLHMMVALTDPTSYSESARHHSSELFRALPICERYSPFVYFSFCTLSTVGYGDIFPLSRLARTLSWIEAVVGQFYMAVFVARLVGLHIAGAAGGGEKETLPDELKQRASALEKTLTGSGGLSDR